MLTGSSNNYNNNKNKQCNLNPPVQSPYKTQTGQLQGGSHSGQWGGHGHHGPTGLHQQSPSSTTGHQHLLSTPQGPHLPPQKQNHQLWVPPSAPS